MFFFEFFQEYQNGDVVTYNYDNAPNHYLIKTIQNIDNYTDYTFTINKINDVGLVLIDTTLKNWSQDGGEQQPSMYVSHNDITAIEFEDIKNYDIIRQQNSQQVRKRKMYV